MLASAAALAAVSIAPHAAALAAAALAPHAAPSPTAGPMREYR